MNLDIMNFMKILYSQAKEVKHQMSEGVILQDIRLPIHTETVQQLSPAVESDASTKRIEALEKQVNQLIQQRIAQRLM